MKKIDKAHHLWVDNSINLKAMDMHKTLKILSRVCEYQLYCGYCQPPYWTSRVNVIHKNGAIIRGYVTYLSDLGGYIVYSNHNVRTLNETNTIQIDVHNIAAITNVKTKRAV